MATQPNKMAAEMAHDWDELHGEVRKRWNKISDEDLSRVRGDIQELIALLQRKTGEAREQIEEFVAGFSQDLRAGLSRAGQQAADYSAEAAATARQQLDLAAERVKEGYQQAQEVVRRRPAESVAVAFGAGVAAGFLVSAMVALRDR